MARILLPRLEGGALASIVHEGGRQRYLVFASAACAPGAGGLVKHWRGIAARHLQFVSAALYSLGHGGNDAQKDLGHHCRTAVCPCWPPRRGRATVRLNARPRARRGAVLTSCRTQAPQDRLC